MDEIFFTDGEPTQNRATRHGRFGEHGITRRSIAKWLYWSRTIRPDEGIRKLYGEPVWDMLLDLYIHEAEGKRVSVTSLCIGSGAPPTTALRYLTILIDQGWVEREIDEADHRRIFVGLSRSAKARMNEYLDTVVERVWAITPDALVESATSDFKRLLGTMEELLRELRATKGERQELG